jgi:hypothetical protein
MTTPLQILRELAEAAVIWKDSKDVYLAESKKQPVDEKKLAHTRKLHLQAVARLDMAVVAFKKLPTTMRKLTKRKKPLDWKKIVDGIAAASSALSKATDKRDVLDLAAGNDRPPVPLDMSRVIDVPSED